MANVAKCTWIAVEAKCRDGTDAGCAEWGGCLASSVVPGFKRRLARKAPCRVATPRASGSVRLDGCVRRRPEGGPQRVGEERVQHVRQEQLLMLFLVIHPQFNSRQRFIGRTGLQKLLN